MDICWWWFQLLHICRQTACNTGHFQKWGRGRHVTLSQWWVLLTKPLNHFFADSIGRHDKQNTLNLELSCMVSNQRVVNERHLSKKVHLHAGINVRIYFGRPKCKMENFNFFSCLTHLMPLSQMLFSCIYCLLSVISSEQQTEVPPYFQSCLLLYPPDIDLPVLSSLLESRLTKMFSVIGVHNEYQPNASCLNRLILWFWHPREKAAATLTECSHVSIIYKGLH